MARIKILELPSEAVGGHYRTPFALVIDQVETEVVESSDNAGNPIISAELYQEEADIFAKRVGAVGAILTQCTLDI